jgi:protein CpxP
MVRNVFKTAVVSAVAAAFVASVAVAAGTTHNQDQQPGPGVPQQGRRGGPGGPGGGRMGPAGVPFEELTEEQRQQIKAIMDEQREGEQGPPADMKLRQSLDTELLADAPNEQRIQELKGQIDAASAAQLDKHIALQRKINQILTPEQRAKARERIANRPENGGGPGRGRRGGGGGGRHI